MSRVTCHMSVSLDGFVAGPDQSRDDPVGRGGFDLLRWHDDTDGPLPEVDQRQWEELIRPRGAYIMGRNMFGPIRGNWGAEDWRGWWGAEPPYWAPVFVLTHHPHDPIEMQGGTTFHFVTDGFDAALAQARAAAGDAEIGIAGGASTLHQALRARVLDELTLDFVPVVLGRGERLFDEVPDLRFESIDVAHSPFATHVRYRVLA